MFYNNLSNNSDQKSKVNNLSYENLIDLYCPDQFLPKEEMTKSIKNRNLPYILENSLNKDFVIPEIFANPKVDSTSVVHMPLEIFYNLNLKNDMIKSELFSSYLREINIVKFIDEKFNKKVNKFINKTDNLAFFENFARKHIELKLSADDLEIANYQLNQEVSSLKLVVKDFENKSKVYEEQIQGLKESVKSINFIFETSIDNYAKLTQKLVQAQKNREYRTREVLETKSANQNAYIIRENKKISDEINILKLELKQRKEEAEKLKDVLKNKTSLDNSKTRKGEDSAIILNLQNDNSSQLLEIELNKCKGDVSLLNKKNDSLQVKLEDAISDCDKLRKDYNHTKDSLAEVIAQRDNLALEIEQKINDNAVISEKNLFLSQANKDLNHSKGLGIGCVGDKTKRSHSPNDLNHNLSNVSKQHNTFKNLSKHFTCSLNLLGSSSNNINNKHPSSGIPTPNFQPMYQNMSISGYNNSSFNNNMLNDSFNKESYNSKKKELDNLRKEVARLKEDNKDLIQQNNVMEKKNINITKSNISKISGFGSFRDIEQQICKQFGFDLKADINLKDFAKDLNKGLFSSNEMGRIGNQNNHNNQNTQNNYLLDKLYDFKSDFKHNNFKDSKRFYIDNSSDLQKLTQKIEEVKNKFNNTESLIANEGSDKKVRISELKDIFAQLRKTLGYITNFMGKYKQDLQCYQVHLKKIFDFISKLIYSDNLILSSCSNSFTNNNKVLSKNPNNNARNAMLLFENSLKMILEFNKIFTQQELKKLHASYVGKEILEIIETFRINCEVVKSNILDTKWDYESKY